MDTLYTLFRSVDNSRSLPLTPSDARELLAKKKTYLSEEAKTNPLAREILHGGTVTCEGYTTRDPASFFAGPPSFFSTHEHQRKTRSKNRPVRIGENEYPHNAVVDMFARCVPNVHLYHAPWCSLARYSTSLGLSWGLALLVAHLVAHGGGEAHEMIDKEVLYHMGLYTTLAALLYTTFKQNRDLRRAAPWNSAMYLDLNADLIRRDSPLAAAARKEFLPKQDFLKTQPFYYALARKIENHGFDAELAKFLAEKTPPPSPAAPGLR